MRIDFKRLYQTATMVFFAATLMCTTALAQTNADIPAAAPVLTQQDFPAQVDVGTVQNLVLQIQHPVGSTVVIESPPNTRRAQLIGQESNTTPSGNGLKTTLTLKYGFFRTGETTLPAFLVNLDSAGKTTPATTTPIQLKVMPVLSAGESLSAPQNPVEMWVDDYTLLWLGGFLLLIISLVLTTWFVRRRANEVVEALPPRPPYDIAIEKLLGLESSGLLERGDYMVFYVRLSETLREYLGERYNFPGTELTTTEIALRLADVKWPLGMELSEVRNILGSSDLVKFGGMIPDVAQGKALLRRAISVVELTKGRFRQPLKAAPGVPSGAEPADSETESEVETTVTTAGETAGVQTASAETTATETTATETTTTSTETTNTETSGAPAGTETTGAQTTSSENTGDKTADDETTSHGLSKDADEWKPDATKPGQTETAVADVKTKDESEPTQPNPSLKWQPPEDSP